MIDCDAIGPVFDGHGSSRETTDNRSNQLDLQMVLRIGQNELPPPLADLLSLHGQMR
jgi:hypothetical protein